jgi:G3E family GTPase
LDRSIEKFIKNKKIRRNYKKREKKEIFSIVKWNPYQADYLKKPPKKSSTYKGKARVAKSEKSDTDKSPILEERKGDKTTQKERRGKERRGEEITSKEKREGDSEDSNLGEVETSSSPPDSDPPFTPEEFSEGVRNSSTLREEGNSRKKEFCALLDACSGYQSDEHADGAYFLWAAEAYPDVDILTETAKKIQWWEDNPTALNDRSKNPHAQLSAWFEEHQEFLNRRNNKEKH